MRYALKSNIFYGNAPIHVEFPDNWEVTVARMAGATATELVREELEQRIRSPIGAPEIREGAREKRSAVIIFDDLTRATPTRAIAEIVLAELSRAGVPDDRIWFMAAVGLHRPMMRADYVRKLGDDIVDRYPVYSHNPFFNCTRLGVTRHGLPVEVNSDVMAAEYKVAIGSLTPHPFVGFGGGGKIILPALSSVETVRRNHAMPTGTPATMGECSGNAVKEDSDDAARMAGLDFKIDAILNESAEVCDLFCGDPIESFYEGVKLAGRHYHTDRVADVDVVVANNYFKASEPGIAKNRGAIDSLVEGGAYVLSTNTPEGAAPHYLNGRWGFTDVGGLGWSGDPPKPDRVGKLIVFSQYPDLGALSWFGRKQDLLWARSWAKVIGHIGDGRKRVAVYPNAAVQIIE
jgi:nickel-dependent lactate racemase